jgi:hypothetical protein
VAHMTKIVEVGLHEIVDGDLARFLAVLGEQWMADYVGKHVGTLTDMTYRLVGVSAQTEYIRIEVTADEDFSGEGDESVLPC